MLLLVTVALVLVAAIALVIGFASNQLPPIYISIACSFVAAVVLAMFSRLNRRRAAPATGSGPAPLDTGPSIFERSATTTTQSPAIRGARPALEEPEEEEEEEPVTVVSAPVAKRPAARAEPPMREPEEEEDLWPDEVVFPIEDYDDLRTAEILPLLEELDDDELEDVRDYEEDHRRRASILRRIDELLRGEEELAPPPAPPRPSVAQAPPPVAPSRRPAFAKREPEPEPEPPPQPSPRTRPEPALTELRAEPEEVEPEEAKPEVAAFAAPGGSAVDDDAFPIADYDKLRVAEILPLLPELEPDELELVAERERAGANRTTVLTKINRLLRPEKVKTTGKAAPAKAARPPQRGGFDKPSNGPAASSPPARPRPWREPDNDNGEG